MTQPETKIKQQIRDYLTLEGWYAFYVIQKAKGYKVHTGISDIIAIKNGTTIYVEVKTKYKKQRESQIKFEADIKNHGGKYFVVRSIEDIEFYLSEEGLL